MDATGRARRKAREAARRRFAATVAKPAAEVRLDVAAFCIAAQAHPGIDVDAWCGRLDELAAGCDAATFEGVRAYLFRREGFTGNTDDYADPENSFLDAVVTRRAGIPITLSVLMMEVGRRLGVDVRGVGMPGHFLVQDGADSQGSWCDPFHGGARYDLQDCRDLFTRLHGTHLGFHPAFLAPSSSHEIIGRMLANLEHGRLAKDPLQLAWMCRLHLALPGLAEPERARLDAAVRSVRARWN
jgi:regulator of sirC expression with transglutaminase-like and TPR domain